ncbi:MAG: hypothetical protein FWH43_00195 [Endomicrobia bacterium]|nr:hypothetical protein [Endomicrobiia bacterium]
MLKKLFSLTIAVALAVSSFPSHVFASAPAAFSADTVNSFASVTDASFKNSAVSVFNIQDLHFHAETQNKIFSLLEKLNASYPNFELYIEGSSENSDFEWVYSSLGKKSGDVFLEALFNSGNIGGAEYFAAKYGRRINSVEDKQIYTKNLILFAELIEKRDEISNSLLPLEERLSVLRNRYFSSEQKRLFTAYQRYRGGSMPDSDYFDFLKKESSKNGIDVNDYPNIALYMLSSGSVMSVSQKRLQLQMSELFSGLKNNLSYKKYSELMTLSNNMKDRQALISYLYQNRDEVQLNKYPELDKFVTSISLSDRLNRLEFINEEGYLLDDLYSKLSADGNSKNIIFMSRFFDVYKNVLTASATAYEYIYYKDNLSKFKNLVSQYVSENALAAPSSFEVKAEGFNDTNLQRNEIFIDKMFGNVKLHEGVYPDLYFGVTANAKAIFENSSKTKVKVIVAGGFHTDGINSILNKKRVNSVTFMPKIASSGKDYSFKYVEYAKLLSAAESSAIPEPVFNELLPAALAQRVLETLAVSGFDLSLQAVKADVEAFLSPKRGMSEINYSYDGNTNEMSLSYKAGGQINVVKLKADSVLRSGNDGTFTALGDFSAETVAKAIRKSIMLNYEDLTNAVYIQVLKMLLGTGEYDTFEKKDALRKSLMSGKFDFANFFLTNPLQMQNLILSLFGGSIISDTSKYNALIKKLKNAVSGNLLETEVYVMVSDSPLLINDDGWCFAALNKTPDDRAVFYIHTALMDKLLSIGNEQRVTAYINALIQHENFETAALYEKGAPIYESFGEYLRSKNLTGESRITSHFHEYLESQHFITYLSQTGRQNQVDSQRKLLTFAKDTYLEYSGRYEKAIDLENITSFQDMDSPLMDDFFRIRIGDVEVLKKYAERIKKKIEDEIIGDKIEKGELSKDDFVIALRQTFPRHITQTIAESVARDLGIKIVYVRQDAYMDTGVFLKEKPAVDLKNKFEIEPYRDDDARDPKLSVVGAEGIPGKYIIPIEDTRKTGTLFAAYARLFNDANAAKVMPIAIFDIENAKLSEDGQDTVDADFSLNGYMRDYIASNPEEIGKLIVGTINSGTFSKYVYNALMGLINDKEYELFKELVKAFNNDKGAKEIFIERLIEIQAKYPELASLFVPLIYAVHTVNPKDDNLYESVSVMCGELKKYKPIGDRTVYDLKEDEYKKWDQPWLIALYAYFNGYTKIEVNLSHSDGQSVMRDQMELLREACRALNISCLATSFDSGFDLSALTEADKINIDEIIKDKRIDESVSEARDKFDKAVMARKAEAAEDYKNDIKAIMNEVDSLVREFLKSKKGYDVNSNDYSIVIGGSLVKGSVTSKSDIYYDFIFSDRDIRDNLKDVLVPAYQYALSLTGITPYLLNGYNLSYIGDDGASSTYTQINIREGDERGVVAIFDFEQIRGREPQADEIYTVFEKYVQYINYMLKKESGKSKFTALIPGIHDVFGVYHSILKNGHFSIESDPEHKNMITFFDNYYASSFEFDEGTGRQYDYRWVLRALELALKEVIIQRITDKNVEIAALPKKTDDLIQHLYDRGYLPEKYGKGDVRLLKEAWKIISLARQEKDAAGNNYKWTPMTDEEKKSIDIISNFSESVKDKYHGIADIKPENKTLQAAETFINYRYRSQYRRIIEKLEKYDFWVNNDGAFSTDTAIALMFSDIENCEDLVKEFEEESGYPSKGVLEVIEKIKKVRALPQYKMLDGDFTLQNYMEEIIRIAGNSDHMTAIFADKLHELLNAYKDDKDESYDLKATIYAVYIPLARRLNANFIFEEMRNDVFAETQKREFNKNLRDIEKLLGQPHHTLLDVLELLEAQLIKALSESKAESVEVHARRKTLYSIFEKVNSPRRSKGEAINIKDVADILGGHIVVDAAERDKVLKIIKNFFEESPIFRLASEGFDPAIWRGFARNKMSFKYNDKKIGELVLYTKEEYEKEHHGLITDSAVSFSKPHWIYKVGEDFTYVNDDGSVKDPKYPDGIFEIKISISHLFGNEYAGSDYADDKSFFLLSDNVVLDGNFSENFEKIREKISENKRITVLKDGMTHILALSLNANGYDLVASSGLQIEGNVTLKDGSGVLISDLSESLEPGVAYEIVETSDPVWQGVDYTGQAVNTLRARMLAKLRAGGMDAATEEDIINMAQKPAELEKAEDGILLIYAHSVGLKNLQELYYVLGDRAISERYGVNIEDIIEFYMDKSEVMYQFKLTGYSGADFDNWIAYAENFLLSELGEDSGVKIINAVSDYDSLSVMMIFSGKKEEIDAAVEKLIEDQKELKMSYFVSSKNDELKGPKSRSVYLKVMQALGKNVKELISLIQEYPVTTANALFDLFESGIIEGLFLDGNQLILKNEAQDALDTVKNSLAESDPKYKTYDYEFIVSDNKDLIFSKNIYAMATLKVTDEIAEEKDGLKELKQRGKVILYVNEVFLRAMENMDDAERVFYLNQLAIHEAAEYVSLLKRETGSYEEFHKSIYSNPDQAKLMEFAAKAARDEMERRSGRQLADEVASRLMASGELKAADAIVILGNDDIATFEKALDLYVSGTANEIIISGGVGRLTAPLIRKAAELGMTVRVNENRVISKPEECADLQKYTDEDEIDKVKEIVTATNEAMIIRSIILYLARQKGIDIDKLKFTLEEKSSNTKENFDNDVVKNRIEEIRAENGGKPARFVFIQKPIQQLRTEATFNAVFLDRIINGKIEGISITNSDFYKTMTVQEIAEQAASELLKLIIYSLKGDTIPSLNKDSMIFAGVLDSDIWIMITALLENSENKSAVRKQLLGEVKKAKGLNKKPFFPTKESIIEALSLRVPQDSYQFETMKMFLDFVYADTEKAAKYKKSAERAFRDARLLSKVPLAIHEEAVKRTRRANAPDYLKSKERVFIFDIENAASSAGLISYMGSYGAKAFSVTQRRYINPDDVLFNFKINTGVRDIDVKAAVKRVQTEHGSYYELQYSVPFIYEIPADIISKEAKEQLLAAVFDNAEVKIKLKRAGFLDLSNSADRLFVESLPQDKSLTTVEAVSERIAVSAGLTGEIRKVERQTAKKGAYNEKLTVAAMLRSSGDTGIGEITSLQSYAETVLKNAEVNGFTMHDLFADGNPLAANYMLLDWMAVPEAQGIITGSELTAADSEREIVNRELVAKRKTLAAVKVYRKLTAEQRAEVDAYYAANSSWLDSFAVSEREKYNIDIEQNIFVRIMAMQQMFFERQLKQVMLQMADMDISMYIKDINAGNAKAIISKWIAAGVTSFTVETDIADENILNNIAAAAAETGFFINVAVKSPNMTPDAANLIAKFGYTPVVLFQDLQSYANVSGYKTEINGETFVKTGSSMSDLLKNSALSGAQSVDYPMGLLWGEVVDDSAAENYRIPSRGSTRFKGFNFGLFRAGQKTFEESYAGSYLNAVEIGSAMDVSAVSFDVETAGRVEVKGKSLPSAYAAVLIGSLAKQNRLSEINNFETVIISLMNALDPKRSLGAARQHLDKLLSDYNSSEDKQKEINAAKIAGFLQGLNEKIIISGVDGKFTSSAIAKVYANLMAEMSLFAAGYYPSSYAEENLVPSEALLAKIEDILNKKTVAQAAAEIEPLLLNLSVPVQKSGFTYEMFRESEAVENKEKANRAAAVYTQLTVYMLDILADKVATREQIRKSAQMSSMAAIKSMMTAA